MKLSMRTDYGVRALVDLAQRPGGLLVRSSEIAARQGVDEQYLDQVLNALRKGGLIRSVRGPRGGHSLARPPESITLADVVDVLEGPIIPADYQIEPSGDEHPSQLARQEIWREVAGKVREALAGFTLDQLAKRQISLASRDTYAI